MGLFHLIVCLAAVRFAWQHGIRDWVALLFVALFAPIMAQALAILVLRTMEPLAPFIVPAVAAAAVVAGWLRFKAQGAHSHAPPANTSAKRRIDRGS